MLEFVAILATWMWWQLLNTEVLLALLVVAVVVAGLITHQRATDSQVE